MAHAEFEHLASLLRVWCDGERYGDPYWGVAVRWISPTEVELELQQQKLTREIYLAVMDACRNAGVNRILVRTFPNGSSGVVKLRWINLS
jgi:hypothetical protein